MRADGTAPGQARSLVQAGPRGRGGVQFLGLVAGDRRVAVQPAAAHLGLPCWQQVEDRRADLREVTGGGQEYLRANPLALADQAEQDVLRADVVVVQGERFAEP
jgi:hypothetical protein